MCYTYKNASELQYIHYSLKTVSQFKKIMTFKERSHSKKKF